MNYKISGAGNSWQVTLGKEVIADVQSKHDAMIVIDGLLDMLHAHPIQIISLHDIKDEIDRVYQDAWGVVKTPAQKNALLKAKAFFDEVDTIAFHMVKGLAFVPSSKNDGSTYTAGKYTCGCAAFKGGKLCRHRVIARIIQKVVTGE